MIFKVAELSSLLSRWNLYKKKKGTNEFLLLAMILIMATSLPHLTFGVSFNQNEANEVYDPLKIVSFNAVANPAGVRPGEYGRLIVHGKLKKGWKIYSIVQQPGEDSLPPTYLSLLNNPSFLSWVGDFKENKPVVDYDEVIELTLAFHKDEFNFYRDFKVNIDSAEQFGSLLLEIQFQVCNDRICLPPATYNLETLVDVKAGKIRDIWSSQDNLSQFNPIKTKIKSFESNTLWSQGLFSFLLLAVGAGLISLLTPCVFPMVPITVSFFLQQEKRLLKAILFSLSIVLTFTLVGVFASILFGATQIGELAVNPYVNIGIAIMFSYFGLSLMGYFDIALPPALISRVDQVSRETRGFVGASLMGVAFTLTAFTCTVQFVGTLLVAAASGNWFWPVLGMLVFSATFSAPFFILAVLPGAIQAWRNIGGGWTIHLKWIVGIIEIGAAFKYLSNASIIWNVEVFGREFLIIGWGTIAVIIALYLLTPLFAVASVESANKFKSFNRLVIGAVSLAFAFYLLVFFVRSASLHPMIETFLPPSSKSSTSAVQANKEEVLVWYPNFAKTKEQAQKRNKPIFLEFTGYTCINCRYMEQTVFKEKDVVAIFKNEFVLGKLYTDGGEFAKENKQFQQEEFLTLSLPFYAIINSAGDVVSTLSGMVSKEEFVLFLKSAN